MTTELTPISGRTTLATGRVQLAGSGDDDEKLLDLWVRSKRKSAHTRANYTRHGRRLLDWCQAGDISLRQLSLDHLLQFAESLADLSEGSQKTVLSAVKAMLTFAQQAGYLQFNVGAALEVGKPKDTLAQRILEEADVLKMLALETNRFRHLLIRVLYNSGGRVSEVCRLQWRDAIRVGESGQLTILGKGGETRNVRLKPEAWAELMALKPAGAGPDAYIFTTRNGKPIARSWAWEVVKQAAKRAGLPEGVSPHWMRHAHASHALDRGAPAHLVKETLGHKDLSTTTKYAHARKSESSADYLPA